jgi:hypothetical protein
MKHLFFRETTQHSINAGFCLTLKIQAYETSQIKNEVFKK